MKKAKLVTILTAILLVICITHDIGMAYSGGSGTAATPYQIANAADLQQLAATTNDYNQCFILTANVNLASLTLTNALIASDTNTSSDDFEGTPFTGVFDGNGHTISNLTITATNKDFVGLFGYVGSGGHIKNMGLISTNIQGGSSNVGGLIGKSSNSIIINCYLTGTVSGNVTVGGLVGFAEGGCIINCYATCNVTGLDEVGGLVGYNEECGTSNCYSTGIVTGTYPDYVGGFIGAANDYGYISNCFFLSTRPDNGIGEPLTDAQMKQQSSFSAWDFLGAAQDGTSEIWVMQAGGYPVFSGYTPAALAGSGTQGDPWLISDAEQLGAIYHMPKGYYKLTSDINLGGITWSTAPIPLFSGNFNGDNKKIINLTIIGRSNLGLFGTTYDYSDSIQNLDVENAKITGAHSISGLIGENKGSVSNCSVTGDISGQTNSTKIGGLTGSNYGSINFCYSSCNVSSSNNSYELGGLAGNNQGSISNCYSLGNVNATNSEYLGGLVGENHNGYIDNSYARGGVGGDNSQGMGGLVGNIFSGNINHCYSTGRVTGTDSTIGGLSGFNVGGTVTASFWDITTSGQASSADGNGMPTASMKMQSTYTDAGWDFINETSNGTYDYWKMPFLDGYPLLSWQIDLSSTGSLQVTISPSEAISAGAQWNVDGGAWQNSDYTVSGLSVGSHTVNYKFITGWFAPVSEQVTITSGQTNSFSRNYTQQTSQVTQFGNVNGKNVKLILKDCESNDVTFSLSGGGYGEIDPCDCSFVQIHLFDTTDKSTLTISTKSKIWTNVGDIICYGPLKGIKAKTATINGIISIGTSLNPKAAVTIVFDQASDLEIDSDMPIKSITATGWKGGALSAPSVGSITVKGDKKRGLLGELYIDVVVEGNIGTVKTKDTIFGDWTCNSIKNISAAEFYTTNITLNQLPDVKTPALGKLTAAWIYSSKIKSQGNIGSVKAGIMTNSSCFAGVKDGITGLPIAETESFPQTATIKSFAIKGIKGESAPYFINSNIAAANILSASIVYPQTINGDPFGMTANYIKSLKIKMTDGTTVSLKDPKVLWTLDNLEIRLY
jgi:hypothetical protein